MPVQKFLKKLLFLSLLFFIHTCKAGSPTAKRIANLEPGTYGSNITEMVSCGDLIFFAAYEKEFGRELWKSNGTPEGTQRITDLCDKGCSPRIQNLTAVGNKLFFTASYAAFGIELWVSDGTPEGTKMLKDINKGGSNVAPENLTAFHSKLLFTADDGQHGKELWISDGTSEGTQLLSDLTKGKGSTELIDITLSSLGALITCQSDQTGFKIFKSDGTSTGTVELVSNQEMDEILKVLHHSDKLILIGKKKDKTLILQYSFKLNKIEEIGLKGITSGYQLLDALLGSDGLVHGLYVNKKNQYEAYKFTNTGTAKKLKFSHDAKDLNYLNSVHLSQYNTWIFYHKETDELLYFSSNSQSDVWNRFFTGESFNDADDTRRFAEYNGRVLMVLREKSGGEELYTSNGTQEGTVRLVDYNQGVVGSNPYFYGDFKGKLLLVANNGIDGDEPHLMDKENRLRLIGDICKDGFVSNISSITIIQDLSCFFGTNYNGDLKVWGTNSTEKGTRVLSFISRKNHQELTPELLAGGASGQIFISYLDEHGTYHVGVSKKEGDYTEIIQFEDNPVFAMTYFMKSVKGGVVFNAADTLHGNELWFSDGTVKGTKLLKDISPGKRSSNPSNFIIYKSQVYFTADNFNEGNEFWKTDGTAQGTVIVKDICDGACSSGPYSYYVSSNGLYFTASDKEHGYELWKSDGTARGTVLVSDIAKGEFDSEPRSFCEMEGVIYFTAYTEESGIELWRTNGTSEGTSMVADINKGSRDSDPSELTSAQNKIIFTAHTEKSGTEIWASEGTAKKTYLVRDLNKGSLSGLVSKLISSGESVFFIGNEGKGTTSVWYTHVRGKDMSRLDLSEKERIKEPIVIFSTGTQLIVVVKVSLSGTELWTISL